MEKILGMVAIAVVAAVNVWNASSIQTTDEFTFAELLSDAQSTGEPGKLIRGRTLENETVDNRYCRTCEVWVTGCKSKGKDKCTPYACEHYRGI